jgi:hypothetical protein
LGFPNCLAIIIIINYTLAISGMAFFLPIAVAPAEVHPGVSLDAGVVERRKGGRRQWRGGRTTEGG